MPAAYVPGPHGPMVLSFAGGGAAATTWNPSDKGADITLSGSNLVATNATGNFSYAGVRTVGSISGADKKYWEILYTTSAASAEDCGAAIAGYSLATDLVSSANALGYHRDGTFSIANVSQAAQESTNAGDTICWAVDYGNGKIWMRKNNNALWNNSGAADPATNTGGFSISGLSGALYPACAIWFQNDAFTAKFASTSWGFAAPSGFSQIV